MEEQPIGAELFKQFCRKDVQLSKCVEFVQELDNFKLVAEEKCAAMAQKVFDNFISLEVHRGIVWEGGRGEGVECGLWVGGWRWRTKIWVGLGGDGVWNVGGCTVEVGGGGCVPYTLPSTP